MQFHQSFQKTLLNLCLIFFVAFSFNVHADPVKENTTRLIIGSGKAVKYTYPMARAVTPRDVTLDIEHCGSDRYLNPTHVLDISRLDTVRFLAKQYPGKFDMIIFEHVGDGFASFGRNQKETDEMLKLYYSMLKPGGTIQYEGYRYSVTFADRAQRSDRVVSKTYEDICFQALKYGSMLPEYNAFNRFNNMIQYYDGLLKKVRFQNVSVKLKADPTYRRYYPSPYPYYYLEIQAKKA